MKTSRVTLQILIAAALFFLMAPRETRAYLDPGNGSYFIQIVIAVALGGLVAMKSSLTKIKRFFIKLFSKRQNTKG